jgi:hypothetical protein
MELIVSSLVESETLIRFYSGIVLTRFISERSGPENSKAAAQLAEETGRQCLPVQADVRKPEHMREAAKQCVDKYGRLDFVICGTSESFFWSRERHALTIHCVEIRCCRKLVGNGGMKLFSNELTV